ncbi:hypothetical protein P5G50_03345 [Leifsonia sp. F6_8S_P_1B]|uniref:Uncharacterized protein n=1 Tax=Leifsonia williamsii TaxID=3035919 RepID=A0ABT8K7Q5_9MICO|nr:hypothetical protein [Leifsonia williamsii]MDN4613481.1 hypothetical protein [Leifsonia williamsii]
MAQSELNALLRFGRSHPKALFSHPSSSNIGLISDIWACSTAFSAIDAVIGAR